MSKEFRRLSLENHQDYYQLVHAAYSQIETPGVSFQAISASQEEMSDWLVNVPTYGMFVDQVLVACVSLRLPWGPQPGYDIYPHIGRLATHPAYAGRGYASQIYHWLEAEIVVKQLASPYLTLGTAANDSRLVKMYEKWGFQPQFEKQLAGNTHLTLFFKKSLLKNGGD
ncbi:hypothetical protein AWM75_07550 [Aerococcus urinaehominis]|uniref:Uncharacterized protein n=1 Tax=Aerococcus urinaehominis TaxID=128944 RepID=A0A0X8FM33_9LACT|nr:GNAT family N-acetyltransferase [Aerococcus urinaehominis]AMB99828.1 hypothetical protein AWM75_07550 [Aerococcus urinaehominis]SDM55499.1 Acetyltransferase (GNAT) family protein [Aerococcus urinaehominis]